MTETIVSQRLFTVEEAADLLLMSRSTLYEKIRDRLVPFRRVSARTVGFTQTDIDEILSSAYQPVVRR